MQPFSSCQMAFYLFVQPFSFTCTKILSQHSICVHVFAVCMAFAHQHIDNKYQALITAVVGVCMLSSFSFHLSLFFEIVHLHDCELTHTYTHTLTQAYLRASCWLPTFNAVQRNCCHGDQFLNWLPHTRCIYRTYDMGWLQEGEQLLTLRATQQKQWLHGDFFQPGECKSHIGPTDLQK